MDGRNGYANNEIPKMFFEGHRLVVGALKHEKGQNLGKIEDKNTKSPIFRPIFHLEHCKSIPGLKKWLCKQNNTKMYFVRYT